jgi:hypothetical protein
VSLRAHVLCACAQVTGRDAVVKPSVSTTVAPPN